MRRGASWGSWWTAALVAIALMAAGCSHKSVEDYLNAGDNAMQNTQLAQAEKDYSEAVKLAPDDSRTHIALGNLYIFEQKIDRARAEFMKVLEIDPKNAAAHAALGNLYFGQSSFGAAEEQYRAAVALEPGRAEYHVRLAQALTKENKRGEAEAALRTAIGLEPKNAAAHLALAALLYTEPDHQAEAKAEYAEAVALNPGLATPTAASTPGAIASVSTAQPAENIKLRHINKRFLLTHDSPVYAKPDAGSQVLARVHQRKFVHVIGIAGDWFQIKMRNGTVGFIPTSAAM